MHRQPLKNVLYLGLEPPDPLPECRLWHVPIIRVVPRPSDNPAIVQFYNELPECTHLLFTSKQAVRIFFGYLPLFKHADDHLDSITVAAVGTSTGRELKKHGIVDPIVAQEETAEGLCQSLLPEVASGGFFFWPHSALSRRVIPEFFERNSTPFRECVFYDIEYVECDSLPALDEIDEIVFTSPSTVDGFLRAYGKIPWAKALTTLGPITKKRLFLLRD